jgi:hypothetical protein
MLNDSVSINVDTHKFIELSIKKITLTFRLFLIIFWLKEVNIYLENINMIILPLI